MADGWGRLRAAQRAHAHVLHSEPEPLALTSEGNTSAIGSNGDAHESGREQSSTVDVDSTARTRGASRPCSAAKRSSEL